MARDLSTLNKRLNERLLATEGRAERELIDNYRSAVDRIRRDLAKVYERYSENGVLTHAEMSKYNRLVALERQIRADLAPAIRANRSLLEKLAQVQYEESFYRHGWAIDQATGVSLKWGMLNPATVKAAVVSPLRDLSQRDLAARTWNQIDRAITQGLIRGVPYREMMNEIKHAAEITAGDAMRIARTEAHRAREEGNYDSTLQAVEQGVVLRRMWVATLDDRTRDSHAGLDGEMVEYDEPFSNGLMKPGDLGGDAAEVINCRCTTVDIIEGYEPETRRVRDEEGLQPYQTFRDWAKERGITGSRYGQDYNYARS